jgi:hypothetical protein
VEIFSNYLVAVLLNQPRPHFASIGCVFVFGVKIAARSVEVNDLNMPAIDFAEHVEACFISACVLQCVACHRFGFRLVGCLRLDR